MSFKVIGIIPARYDSSRFPGKPLADIGGKPMIQRVWERAVRCKQVESIIVATDDQRIYDTVQQFSGEVIMTPSELKSGSDRVAFAAKDYDSDIIVNIQGDEPFIDPDEIDLVAKILINDPEPVMGTLVKEIKNIEELKSLNTAKVVIDKNNYAIYFSRSPIPFNRDIPDLDQWVTNNIYYKHIGIYSYRHDFLEKFVELGPGLLEEIEHLEQLRVLENGYRIKTAVTEYEPVSVDTREDLDKAREKYTAENIS